MIIITGVGRCGTSFMAKFLKECELDIGSDRWYAPINAGLENRHTLSINQRLIRHFIKGEEIDLEEVEEDILSLVYDAVKDPQFLADPRIIEFWHDVREDIEIVFLVRKPEDIVESCKRVPEWSSPVYRLFPEMIEAKNKAFLEAVNDLEIDYIQYEFPFFLGYPRVVINGLRNWIEIPKNALEVWNKIRE